MMAKSTAHAKLLGGIEFRYLSTADRLIADLRDEKRAQSSYEVLFFKSNSRRWKSSRNGDTVEHVGKCPKRSWLTSEFLCSFKALGDREVIIDKKAKREMLRLESSRVKILVEPETDPSFCELSGDFLFLEYT